VVALVTGAGSGIGREAALALAAEGAAVMGVGRTEATLARLAEDAAIEYVVESVATEDGCERIVEETRRRLGPIGILVNNAGIDPDEAEPIWRQATENWRDVLATNLNGPYYLTRLVAAEMVERRSGRIVMVASTAGQVGGPRMAAYCASKHGLLGLMRSVAHDVAPFGVTCNAVCPGWVRTEMSDWTAANEAQRRGIRIEEVWRERESLQPAGRALSPAEVAGVIAFLASPGASGINGEAITVALGSSW
jgi:NAD(P)-dependent dehydrogenase (short-subunit alcohol dehydrogenase family)